MKKEPNTPAKKDQSNLERTDPDTKKGYNEKNPSQPQGAFHPDSKNKTVKDREIERKLDEKYDQDDRNRK